MNIHKIDTQNNQKHKNFLTQNRKDPITGDNILEGNEVVFCASCKSVFLKETWNYLGNTHCEQNKTLKNFPLNEDKIRLEKSDQILFYSLLPIESKGRSTIPMNLDKKIWKTKKRKLSKNFAIFRTSIICSIIVGFVIGFWFAAETGKRSPIVFSLIFMMIMGVILMSIKNSKGKKVKTIHREFVNNVFYISENGIGFSSPYGMKERTLNADSLSSLYFRFDFSYFDTNKCTIVDATGRKIEFGIKNYFKSEKTERKNFLDALYNLRKTAKIPISITIKNSELVYNDVSQYVKVNKYGISVR